MKDMLVEAWIQMGCERREVTFPVTEAEQRALDPHRLEFYIQDTVLDWIRCRYGFGWKCSLFENDYSDQEDSTIARYYITEEIANPNTVRKLIIPGAKPQPSLTAISAHFPRA